MKRITGFAIIVLVLSMLITGCGSTIPDLSEEQTELVTEYATGLLLKYNSIPGRSLLNDSQLEIEEKKEEEQREKEKKKEEAAQAYLAAQEAANSEKKSDVSLQTEEASDNIDDLAKFYGLDGFSISYIGYQLCQSYPDEEREDFFLAMDATQGKQLCIVQFNVTNILSEEHEFDMFEKQGKFYLSIDGQDKVPAQSTLLLDDLASYKGVLSAENQEQMILVFEVEQSIQQISTMELTAKYDSKKGSIVLQ